jgi:serpin B
MINYSKKHISLVAAAMTGFGVSQFPIAASAASPAAQSVNALGFELLTKSGESQANALLSPYSIQSALAMTFAGAAGETRAEMGRVLHYTGDEGELHRSFAALQRALDEVQRTTAERASNALRRGGPSEPVVLTVANRLFGQQGYDFRENFLGVVRDNYGAPFQPMDFLHQAPAARLEINSWVENQTRQRIRDLIPPNGVDRETQLVLVNAIYVKAPWAEEFSSQATKPQPFHVQGGAAQEVPTMFAQKRLGYSRREGYSVVTIPYSGGEVQFVVLLPDAPDGLAELEAKVTPEVLASCANAGSSELLLYLPRFKLEPPLMKLGQMLRGLGMKSAFDNPRGSANFDRMAPRKPDDYLFISEVFHKTFLALDEKGTEAAAATAVIMARPTSAVIEKPKPVEVRVDRPFVFAIQHRTSGACLFLGRVTDPR